MEADAASGSSSENTVPPAQQLHQEPIPNDEPGTTSSCNPGQQLPAGEGQEKCQEDITVHGRSIISEEVAQRPTADASVEDIPSAMDLSVKTDASDGKSHSEVTAGEAVPVEADPNRGVGNSGNSSETSKITDKVAPDGSGQDGAVTSSMTAGGASKDSEEVKVQTSEASEASMNSGNSSKTSRGTDKVALDGSGHNSAVTSSMKTGGANKGSEEVKVQTGEANINMSQPESNPDGVQDKDVIGSTEDRPIQDKVTEVQITGDKMTDLTVDTGNVTENRNDHLDISQSLKESVQVTSDIDSELKDGKSCVITTSESSDTHKSTSSMPSESADKTAEEAARNPETAEDSPEISKSESGNENVDTSFNVVAANGKEHLTDEPKNDSKLNEGDSLENEVNKTTIDTSADVDTCMENSDPSEISVAPVAGNINESPNLETDHSEDSKEPGAIEKGEGEIGEDSKGCKDDDNAAMEEQEEKNEEDKGKDDEEEDDDDDDKDDSAEGKKRMARSSPIRCFDESIFTVEKLFEYQWPQTHGEYFFVQEQISEYLAVTSFKRKYPALERRMIGMEERRFLKEKGVVTEEQVTLGLTALKADEVYDVMQKDFPAKYAAYARLIQQRQREAIKNKHKEYGTLAVDEAKMKNYIKKAVRQAAEYNALLMKQRRDERQYYLDLQTMLVHCPQNKMKKLTKEQSKPGPYPVAVIPGQYQNYFKSYTPEELKYMPVNTAIYGPRATQKQSDIGPDIPPGGEVSSDDEDLSVSSEPQKPAKPEPSKSTSKGTGKTPAKSTPSKQTGKTGSKATAEKESTPMRQTVIEPPFDHEKINPAFFKDQVQSVLPQHPAEMPMISLQPSPMVTQAPPPPVTQVLSQLLQQKGIAQLKPPVYVPKDIPDAICGLCLKDKEGNRKGEPEDLVHCSQCDNSGHPSCLEMSPDLVIAIKKYPWQCMECKTCTLCGDPTHEDKMMFCDECDRGYHTFCVGLTDLPTGLWACASCRCVPPAQPLPPPPIEAPPAMTNLIPKPVNGSPESTTAGSNKVLKTPGTKNGTKNGTKRPAEPIVAAEEAPKGEVTKENEPIQAPTPPPSKKRNTKRRQATPAKS